MTSTNILEAKKISKSFHGVHALNDVDFSIREGEVHGLLGENGAGKSTLMKIIMGIYQQDSGEVYFNYKKLNVNNPSDALQAGLSMIHQELNPIPDMTVAENIFLGREMLHKKIPFLNRRELKSNTEELLNRFKLPISPSIKMRFLSVANMQMVEIIKALSYDSRLIVMDEPTSALSDEEVIKLFDAIQTLRKHKVAVIYISHRMEEIFEIVDRVTVLRDGKYIGTENIEDINKAKLISMMVGRELDTIFPKVKIEIGSPVLEVKDFSRANLFSDISFKVHKGEILGIAGLVGSGRSEIARAIIGLDRKDNGEIYLQGKKLKIRNPRDAIRNGISMVTEDRKEYGLMLTRSIKENISLSNLGLYSFGPFVRLAAETSMCGRVAEKLSVKMRNLSQVAEDLSGGNQQKVVISKWIMEMPKVLILDEPTRGIDVGAKAEIHRLMSEFASQGMAIIMISSEMPEIMGMSDRIIVIGRGRIRGEFTADKATQEEILEIALHEDN